MSPSLCLPHQHVSGGGDREGELSVNSVVETVGQVDLVTKPLQLWSGHVVYSCHLQSSAWMDISGWEESKHGRSSFMSTTWQIFLQISPKWDLPYSISTGSSTAHSHHVWKAHRCIWSTRECVFFVVLFYFFFNQTCQKHARSYHFHVQVKHGKENIKHKKKKLSVYIFWGDWPVHGLPMHLLFDPTVSPMNSLSTPMSQSLWLCWSL